MLSVAARGSSPEERKTVSTLHLRLLTPFPGQRVMKIAKFFSGFFFFFLAPLPVNSLSADSCHPLPSSGQEFNSLEKDLKFFPAPQSGSRPFPCTLPIPLSIPNLT